ANFAGSFAGIGKAQAVALWNGSARILHLTVAGAGGDAFDPSSPLYRKLAEAIASLGDGLHLPRIDSYRSRQFHVAATLAVDPDHETAPVHDAALAALRGAFSFESRTFGQPVTEVEIIALLQDVPGVTFVR